MTRRLVLLRHAKSAYPTGVLDHDRPLGPRGVVDAAAAGRWLRDSIGLPDHVVVSSAVRARQTWDLAAEQLKYAGTVPGAGTGAPGSLTIEPRIYDADPRTLLEVAREQPDAATTVVLVGHNPGCEMLVDLLAGEREPEAARAIAAKYPTSGIAVLEHELPWAQLTERSARLIAFAVPRG